MKLQTIALALALAATPVLAQDKMAKDPMKPSMQECKDMMAMKKDGMKKDDAMMKKETMCADMMKKDGGSMMKSDGMMKSDPAPKK